MSLDPFWDVNGPESEVEKRFPVMIGCLAAHGVAVHSAMTSSDVDSLADGLLRDLDHPVDCYKEAAKP